MSRRSDRVRAGVLATSLLLGIAAPASAQHEGHAPVSPPGTRSGIELRAGAHAVPLVTRVSPIVSGDALTEIYLTQPTLAGMAAALGGAVRANAAISLEGLTIDRGELGAGAYGEGYVDRRHPHTYLHELAIAAQYDAGLVSGSLTAGRGFAPFGTDDPMMRPFVKFPVNHHLGQVLERLMVIGGLRVGPAVLEAGVFNGNEPLDANDTGSLDRFGDSWAARLLLRPLDGVELQVSHASLESPEFPPGGGWDQRKWSAAARYEREHAFGAIYALAEWNRTVEVDNGADVFAFGSVLAEAALDVHGWRPGIRLERAERPEEQRGSDRFRSQWPHAGGHVLGITRWTTASARIERSVTTGVFGIAPFIEGSMARVTMSAEGLFDPREFYGGTTIWTLNVGARLRAGWHPARMGRYGVAAPTTPAHAH